AHLMILAIALTFLRSRMRESPIWMAAQSTQTARFSMLLTPQHLRGMTFLIGMYGIWNLYAGTIGFFFPYILRTVGGQSQAAAVLLQATIAPLVMVSTIFVFMRYSDRVNQRLLFALSASLQIVGMSLLAICPLTLPVVIGYLLLSSLG